VLSSDIESKAIAKLKEKDDKPVAKVDSEAGVLSRVRSNDALLCPPQLDLSKTR
jgi:chorismate mutase